MKKFIAILLTCLMLFVFTSCTEKKETSVQPSVTSSNSVEPTESETPTPTLSKSEVPTPTPTESVEPTESFEPDPVPGTGLYDVWINTVNAPFGNYTVTLTLSGEEGSRSGSFEFKCQSAEQNDASISYKAAEDFSSRHNVKGSYTIAEDETITLTSAETMIGSLKRDRDIILFTPAESENSNEVECYIRRYAEGNFIERTAYLNTKLKVEAEITSDRIFSGFTVTVKMMHIFEFYSDTRAQLVIEADKEQTVAEGISAVYRDYFDAATQEDPTLTKETLEEKWLSEYGKTVSEWADEQYENYMNNYCTQSGFTNVYENFLDVVINKVSYTFMNADGKLLLVDLPGSGADFVVTK